MIPVPLATPDRDSRTHGVPSSDGWRLRVPTIAALAALVALVAVPILGDLYVRPLHHEMRVVAEPGRSLVTQIHVALAIEGAVLNDYLESRDTSLVRRYREALASEQQAYERLRPLAARLGESVAARFAEVDSLQAAWHAGIDRYLSDPETARAARSVREVMHEDVYEELLLSSARLDGAINDAAQQRRAAILAAERTQRWSTAVLGLLALVAAVIVTWLGRRVRAFAVESERRRLALEQAAESRARLMRGISHDLKNPLGAIDGHAQLLEEGILGPLAEPQLASIGRIRKSVRSLLTLVEDLLELSRAEAGQLRIVARAVPFDGIVHDVVEEHRASAAAHDLSLEVAPSLPVAYTDPERVRQILGNLLSNAIKYTPQGGRIVVRARLHEGDQGDAARWLAVDVIDSGSGIPADKVESIFDEFSRLEEHAAKPGAGLGLSIARRIARLLGGDITIAPAELGGAAFTLWLPRDRREA